MNKQVAINRGILVGLILAAALFTGLVWIEIPRLKIQSDAKLYATVTRGMTKAQVIQIMGEPTQNNGMKAATWDGQALTPEDQQRLAESIEYDTDTLTQPVAFVFSFDEQGKLVAKSRFN